jgi:NAD(P)-dependent dehydrogenase (short-subunit alcohol dehydrogenase family)
VSPFERARRIPSRRKNILVNNAGISQIGNVEATPEDPFDRIIRVNVMGYYNYIYASIGQMKAQGGVILNIASIAGSVGVADRFGYSTSKGAIIAMTYSVARDYLAHNIRCNCMAAAVFGRSSCSSRPNHFQGFRGVPIFGVKGERFA